jgi:FixJ family two-component response regulator
MKNIETYKDCVIYLVDDDIIIRDSLSVLIQSEGLIIKCYASAEAFLKNYIPDQPGCLILDFKIPVMNGLELQEKLSNSSICIPIIFISGHSKIRDVAKAFRAGALYFFEKPFDAELLIRRIYEALARDIDNTKLRLEKYKTQAFFDTLTVREKEVLQLIINNYSNKKVAIKLEATLK